MHVDMVSARQKNNVYITHKRSRWAEFRKYQHYIFLKCRNKSKACSISELINTQHVWLNMCVINSKEICKQNGKCSLAVQGVRSVHWNNYLYIQVLRLEHEMSLFRFICGISAGRGWSRQTVGSSPPSPPLVQVQDTHTLWNLRPHSPHLLRLQSQEPLAQPGVFSGRASVASGAGSGTFGHCGPASCPQANSQMPEHSSVQMKGSPLSDSYEHISETWPNRPTLPAVPGNLPQWRRCSWWWRRGHQEGSGGRWDCSEQQCGF